MIILWLILTLQQANMIQISHFSARPLTKLCHQVIQSHQLQKSLKQKIIAQTNQEQQQALIASLADTLVNSDNQQLIKSLMIWHLSSIIAGDFYLRTFEQGPLTLAPVGIPATSYLFNSSMTLVTFDSDLINTPFQQMIHQLKRNAYNKDADAYLRPSTHAYVLRESFITEEKSFVLGLLALIKNWQHQPENYGHDLVIGSYPRNEIHQTVHKGRSGTCLLFQKDGDQQHALIGYEQQGTKRFNVDKFNQYHSPLGSQDKFTAPNGLYGNDSTAMMKHILDPTPSQLDGLNVVITAQNFPGIQKTFDSIQGIINQSNVPTSVKKSQLIALLQKNPRQAIKYHQQAFFYQNFMNLNFSLINQDIQQYILQAPKSAIDEIHKLLTILKHIQSKHLCIKTQQQSSLELSIQRLKQMMLTSTIQNTPIVHSLIYNHLSLAKACYNYLMNHQKLLCESKK
ncbi:hypothetical protein N9Y17_03430 [Gammaproteobacteria bacterium]|nr:hypothetical protein [Gammaproteobacteria bacterium]